MKYWVLLFLFVLFSSFNQEENNEFHLNGLAQGTTYHITYWAQKNVVDKKAIDLIFSQIDSSLSIYKPYSLINQFNNANKSIKADAHLAKVVARSIDIFNDTEGKFDITVYPLVTAWGFGSSKIDRLPDSAAISALMPCIGSQKIKLVGQQLIKTDPCVKIDVNGIAQGYTVDVIANYLEQMGIKNYLVEVGGELRVAGKKPNGQLMKIGIESPSANEFDEPILTKIISIPSGAITTSGGYRKYIESGNKRLPHLIDPKTGYPIAGEMVSITVYAQDAITADGYDNPLMAMTVEQALTFVKNRKEIEAYLIYRKKNGTLADTATSGFKKFFVEK
jgi:thiamine biosynthesis lipoprotein